MLYLFMHTRESGPKHVFHLENWNGTTLTKVYGIHKYGRVLMVWWIGTFFITTLRSRSKICFSVAALSSHKPNIMHHWTFFEFATVAKLFVMWKWQSHCAHRRGNTWMAIFLLCVKKQVIAHCHRVSMAKYFISFFITFLSIKSFQALTFRLNPVKFDLHLSLNKTCSIGFPHKYCFNALSVILRFTSLTLDSSFLPLLMIFLLLFYTA